MTKMLRILAACITMVALFASAPSFARGGNGGPLMSISGGSEWMQTSFTNPASIFQGWGLRGDIMFSTSAGKGTLGYFGSVGYRLGNLLNVGNNVSRVETIHTKGYVFEGGIKFNDLLLGVGLNRWNHDVLSIASGSGSSYSYAQSGNSYLGVAGVDIQLNDNLSVRIITEYQMASGTTYAYSQLSAFGGLVLNWK